MLARWPCRAGFVPRTQPKCQVPHSPPFHVTDPVITPRLTGFPSKRGKYLMFDDFKSGVAPSLACMASHRRDFPLPEYAAHFWGVHASFATKREWSLAEKFFSTRALPHGGNYGAWLSCLIPDCHPDVAMDTEPLYYAASFGMVPMVRALVSESTSIDLEHPGGRYGSTALQVACFRGRREVAEILLAASADFWSSGTSESAWFWAQSNSWTHLVDYMVQLRPEIADKPKLNFDGSEHSKSTWTSMLCEKRVQQISTSLVMSLPEKNLLLDPSPIPDESTAIYLDSGDKGEKAFGWWLSANMEYSYVIFNESAIGGGMAFSWA